MQRVEPKIPGRLFRTGRPGRIAISAIAGWALASTGCQVSPVPRGIEELHTEAGHVAGAMEPFLEEGDIIFRLSRIEVVNGLADFGRLVSYWTDSPFSHVGMVYRKTPDLTVMVDTSTYGIERKSLVDWCIQGPRHVVVKRLKPEYRHLLPAVMAQMEALVRKDVLYNETFGKTVEDRYYCTEIVDLCFRNAGHPLAPRVKIGDLPNIKHSQLFYGALGATRGISLNTEVAVCGNETYGMFSSPMLYEVANFIRYPQTGVEPGPEYLARVTFNSGGPAHALNQP